MELWEMSSHLKNIILIRKCYWDLLLYSPSTTQQNFLFYKIPIFVKSRVGDGLCISKMSFHLENINLIRKCYMGLLLYSPSKTQQNFYFSKYYICVSNFRDIHIWRYVISAFFTTDCTYSSWGIFWHIILS